MTKPLLKLEIIKQFRINGLTLALLFYVTYLFEYLSVKKMLIPELSSAAQIKARYLLVIVYQDLSYM